jgi:predicted  nucleic acid-binding Zn-ribbon protein
VVPGPGQYDQTDSQQEKPMRALSLSSFIFAFAALAGVALISTAAVAGESKGRDIVIDIGEDGELLEQLIEMDADDIADMRAEFAEARADIKEAIADVADARSDVKGVPGGGVILKIAFATARSSVSVAVDEALGDARREIDRAARDLKGMDVSAEERAETEGAILTLREELDLLEVALEELMDALRA